MNVEMGGVVPNQPVHSKKTLFGKRRMRQQTCRSETVSLIPQL